MTEEQEITPQKGFKNFLSFFNKRQLFFIGMMIGFVLGILIGAWIMKGFLMVDAYNHCTEILGLGGGLI